jgi:hypothetical protein
MTMFPAEDEAGDERLSNADAASSAEATAALPDAEPTSSVEATATPPDAEPSPAAAVAPPRKPAASSLGDAFAALHDDGPQRHGAALRYSVELLAYYYAAQGRRNPAQEALRTLVTDRFDILDTPQFGLYAPKGQGAAVADAGLRIMDALNAESVADPVWAGGAADSTEAQRRADYAEQARGGRWVMDITGRHAILRDAQGRSVLAGSNISRVRLKGVPVVGFVMNQADQVQPVEAAPVGRFVVEDRPAADGDAAAGEFDARGDTPPSDVTQVAQKSLEPAPGPNAATDKPPSPPRPKPQPAGDAFRETLWRAEQDPSNTGKTAPNYREVNERAHGRPMGKYQLTEGALKDAGYVDKNGKWQGSPKYRITSEEAFKSSPAAQEDALDRYMDAQARQLRAKGTMRYIGAEINGLEGKFTITESGLAAAAHRQGAGAVNVYFKYLEAHGWKSDFSALSNEDKYSFQTIERRLRTFEHVPLR